MNDKSYTKGSGGLAVFPSPAVTVICKTRSICTAVPQMSYMLLSLRPTMGVAMPVKKREEGLYLPTIPKAETALDRPEEPFWPILVRFPRSRRPSNSRISCWLYTCYRQIPIYINNAVRSDLFINMISILLILPCNKKRKQDMVYFFLKRKEAVYVRLIIGS